MEKGSRIQRKNRIAKLSSARRFSAGWPYPKKTWVCAGLGAVFLGITSQWGSQLEKNQNVDFTAPSGWLTVLLTSLAAAPLLAFGFTQIKEWETRQADREEKQRRQRWREWQKWLLTSLGLFLFWLPVFLAVYPGFFAYDATDELTEVLTGNYVTRHPLLHVLLLGKTVTGLQKLTGSYNSGIAVYVLLQMAGMALLLSWVLKSLRQLGAGRMICLLGFLFLALFPVVPMYVLCTSKDMPFTAGMLTVLILLCRLAREKEAFFYKKGPLAGLGAGLFVMAVFRNNGFPIFLLLIPALLFLAGKSGRRRMVMLSAAVLAACIGLNTVLNRALDPVDTGAAETFTVPIQQLARTWKYSPEVFSQEDRQTLFEILPEETLALYTPKLSDLVKAGFITENFEKEPEKYASLWLRTGLKAPFTYGNAWLMTSYGFWYPNAAMDVYNGWRNYEESSYFSFETETPGIRDSRFPWLEEQYRKLSWENAAQNIPVFSLLFSPGFLCWLWVLSGLYLIAAGRQRELTALLPVYLNLLTVLFGPTYLVRYVLIFWFGLPLLASLYGPRVKGGVIAHS